MADNNPPPEEDGDWPRPPYAWIIAPLLIFVLIAMAATLLQLRRRSTTRRFAAARAQRVGGPQQQQLPRVPDLEAGRSTRTRRWGGMRRREEPVDGLDENGDAPPPYQPAGAKKEDVELREVAESPPDYGDHGGDASAVRAPPAALTYER